MSFTTLGLSEPLLRAVADQGYNQPTPIQKEAIPVILDGKDVLAGAQTGTGKTAGFTLPLLHLLNRNVPKPAKRAPVRALVLVPTRELAVQVADSVNAYGRYLPQTSAVIYGGVSSVPQVKLLRRGVDIVIATPGRLLDHVRQKNIDLSKVEYFILDEADRMLDMGFIRDIRAIMSELPKQRQNLLFSATFSGEIKALADTILRQPARIEVARRNTASECVKQVVHPVDKARKREVLSHLIRSGSLEQVLVFTRTKHGANRLCKQLESDGIRCAAIHGNKSQSARTKALSAFKQGAVRVLVATDIAARGIDIDLLPHVVNFELPEVAEDYVHRIGRTGRAGNEGEAFSLVSAEERGLLRNIEKLIKRTIERIAVPGFETDPSMLHAPDQQKSRTRSTQKPRGRSATPAQTSRRNSRRPQHSSQRGDR